MSAIFGVYHLHGQPVTRDELAAMDQGLASCGPDGQGVWLAGPVGMGQRLLHTTPESRHEQQPLVSSQGHCVLVADARLDDRDGLAATLGIAPVARATLPDSALLLAAYARWGDRCGEHLLGDFAFAVWDQTTRTLVCVRDHLGVKPLYYCHLPGRLFVWASQMAGLLMHPDVPRRLNARALAYHLVLYRDDPAITFFADCWRLPPGHLLRARADGLTVQRYWTPEPSQEIRLASDAAYVDAARALLIQAVHDRVRTVVPVGAHVSGGLDSSAVVCIAAAKLREAAQPLTGFTWSVPPAASDNPQEGELPFIAAVCTQAGLTRHAPQSPIEAMRDVHTLHCGPLGMMPRSAQEMAMHDLAHAQGVRVLLSGVGGDEGASFNGRGYWAALARQGQWLHLAQELAWYRQRIGASWPRLIISKVVEPFLPALLWRPYRRALGRQLSDHMLGWSYIRPALAHRLRLAEQLWGTALRERPGVRTNQLRLLLHGNLVARMEEWGADAARWGLDYRHPLLDRRLLEFCLALPPEQYIRQGWTRYLFRRAIAPLVPASLPWQRDKQDPVSVRQSAVRRVNLWPLLRQPLAQYAQNPLVHTYVDIPRMQAALEALCAAAAPMPPRSLLSRQEMGFSLALMTAAFVHRYG